MVLRLTAVLLFMAQTMATQVTMAYVVNRFVDKWNICFTQWNAGVLDLKSCRTLNDRWKAIYNHEEWPK